MVKKIKFRHHHRVILSAAGIVAVISVFSVAMTLFVVPLLSHNEAFTDFVYQLGPLGPFAYVVIQAIQSLIPVWSGQPFEVFGGALYGWWAMPLIWIGSLIAYAIAFLAVRHLGRPIVKRLVGEQTLEQFSFLLNARSGLPFFICTLIPFFPDDLVCFGGGLTKFSLWKYLAIVALGRPLAIAVNTALGIGIDNSNITLIAVIIAICAVAIFLLHTNRALIMRKLRQLAGGES
jgi:uncharacterized membrane protein YdjX (TVP38/TMEM64 family)